MHVIRHQHVRVDRAPIVLGVELQPMQIEPIILLGVEARRAVVAALEDEQRHITKPGSRVAWHAGAGARHFRRLSQAIRALLQRCASQSADSLARSEEHTSELQSQSNLVCRLLLEKKKKTAGR